MSSKSTLGEKIQVAIRHRHFTKRQEIHTRRRFERESPEGREKWSPYLRAAQVAVELAEEKLARLRIRQRAAR
jgi:hypothetical protein